MEMQALYRLLIVLFLCACTPKKTLHEPVPSDTYFPFLINNSSLKLQLALNESERNKGLMYRDSLPKNHGMLFLFKDPGRRSFWMRNTQIPLDIAYFNASGKLLEIHSLYPYDENPVQSHSQDVLIAIETNRGWFSRNEVKPGAQLDLEALVQAVRSRGYETANYSLKID